MSREMSVSARAQAWVFRWVLGTGPGRSDDEFRGRYSVTVAVDEHRGPCEFVHTFPAVVDDFGNLVRVPS